MRLRPRRIARALARGVVYLAVALLVLGGAGLLALESQWGKNQIRNLIVAQSNRFLTGTLEIDRVEGSLFRGVEFEGVRLVQDGTPTVTIRSASLVYSIRELYESGTVIRSLNLRGLHVVGARGADGRWNLGNLVRPRPPRPPGRPARLIAFERVDISDGTVEFLSPLTFGAAHVPSRLDNLEGTFAFELRAPAWSLSIDHVAWRGSSPELNVKRLAGGIGTGPEGWSFDGLQVETPRSQFEVTGRIVRGAAPTSLDLAVKADRFAFQEWGGVLTGLRNIAVESAFTANLNGPLNAMSTSVELKSNAGSVKGAFTLDSSVPGWHGKGTAEVARLNLAHWFNRRDRPSDVTGRVTFDLDLQLGQRFPRGTYRFVGPHAAYLGYEADHVEARGRLTHQSAIIEAATATAYGANVGLTAGSIGIDAPYPFSFAGRADGVDLRQVPESVPVPHVESTLAFGYDVTGQFGGKPFLIGRAAFDQSEFLGVRVSDGSTGSIDTSVTPFSYAGAGELTSVSLRQLGDGLDIEWMRDARYGGVINGRFQVEGSGAETETMTLHGGGRITRGEMFEGILSDADVAIDIADGSLSGRYDGRFERVNPARAFDDPRLAAVLTGSGRVTLAVQDLLTRTTGIKDYTIDGSATLVSSTVRNVPVEGANVTARLADGALTIQQLSLTGDAIAGSASGIVMLDGADSSNVEYDVVRLDLPILADVIGRPIAGLGTTRGRMTGSTAAPRLAGSAQTSRITSGSAEILSGAFDYDVVVPIDSPQRATGRLSGRFGPLAVGTQAFNELVATATVEGDRITLEANGTQPGGFAAALVGNGVLHLDEQAIDISGLTVTVRDVSWVLLVGSPRRITWNDDSVSIDRLVLADRNTAQQRLDITGTWRYAGGGTARITAAGVYLDPFTATGTQPARYGGRLDADATVRMAEATGATIVTGTFTISEGRIRRLSFDKLTARIGYADAVFDVDVRLDQGPGVWLSAVGTVPMALAVKGQPDRPMRLVVESSPIDLGILEGVTDVIHDVSGQLQLNVTAVGTGEDPHFEGTVEMTNAAFAVRTTGSRYRNGRLAVNLAPDRVAVQALHLEDSRGRTLDVTGSLGTHELRVGEVEITAAARQFEVVRNEFGNVEVDASLNLRGQFESPKLTGALTITGGQLNVDEILDRTLMRPYSTEAAEAAAPSGELDALVALNPWERIALDISVTTRGTLRMIGDNVQVTPGTPLGLGNVNVRAFGELYLYKDPAQPLFITGSLDSLIGTYSFQGRRFDLDPISSVAFRGDLNPELYITVTRVISGVETRVGIIGPLNEPELRLSSTPPLDASDILSLIVFNTSLNQLSASQQQELAYRAGTLAAGFLAAPLLGAVERSIGLEILEIEPPSDSSTGPRVTIGDEIAPGLIARFSRQFGQQEYNEAAVEYYLSRLFRIRATFSDASSTLTRNSFRRVERAGIDLLLFLSF